MFDLLSCMLAVIASQLFVVGYVRRMRPDTPSIFFVASTPIAPLQSLFLKMVTRREDGSTDALTSMHCDAGTSTEFCLVEVTYSITWRITQRPNF